MLSHGGAATAGIHACSLSWPLPRGGCWRGKGRGVWVGGGGGVGSGCVASGTCPAGETCSYLGHLFVCSAISRDVLPSLSLNPSLSQPLSFSISFSLNLFLISLCVIHPSLSTLLLARVSQHTPTKTDTPTSRYTIHLFLLHPIVLITKN